MTVTVKNKTKIPLVVPASIRRRAGHRDGESLEFSVSGGVITILPKLPAADDDYTPAERRAIDRGIAHSEKEYAAGKSYGPFDTHEAFVASLHREAAKLKARKTKRTAK
jgi:bifunctional DNA-binding transcriptional regulator/antitoxin component of YhaV-PrlF toxin-antitoxin module